MSRFFENEMEFGMNMSPNDFYRGTQQAFVNDQWENTTVEEIIEEQDYIGANTYHKVSVWVSKTIGTTSTFMKNGADFRTLLYRKLDYHPIRGTYFKFEDNWWIADFTNPADGVMGDVGIRRCTNYLKIIDPENGSIFSVPCVLDYDMTSPSMTVTNAILTPNNHANIIVQANPDTMRLFTYNKRFVLNGRVFKLTAFQNALYASISEKKPTILYLDMILDETHDGDDLINEVANNGDYNYEIIIGSYDITVSENHENIPITAYATLNGERTDKKIEWSSSTPSVAEVIDEQVVFHNKGATVLKASLYGNPDVRSEIKVYVKDAEEIVPLITMTDYFNSIRQFETKTTMFELNGGYISSVECKVIVGNAIEISVDNDKLTVKCIKPSKEAQVILVTANTPEYGEVSQEFEVRATSMLG